MGKPDHEYVYPPVPPVGVTDAVPLHNPHDAVVLPIARVRGGGFVNVSVLVERQPFTSPTVTEYVPAQSAVAEGVVCTGAVDHE